MSRHRLVMRCLDLITDPVWNSLFLWPLTPNDFTSFLFLNLFFIYLSWIINKVWYRCTLMATAMLCWTKLGRGYLHTLRCGTIHCARVIHKLRWQLFWYFFSPLTYQPICTYYLLTYLDIFKAKQKIYLWVAMYLDSVWVYRKHLYKKREKFL